MNKSIRILFWTAMSSFIALIVSSIVILCCSIVPLWAPYIPLPFALIGIILEIVFCFPFTKSNYSIKTKAKFISAFACFSFSLISAAIFILLFWEGWYGQFQIRKTIAIVIPITFLVIAIVLFVFIKIPPRRPTRAARLEARVAELEQQLGCPPPPRANSDVESLEQQIAELQKQIDELKKGE